MPSPSVLLIPLVPFLVGSGGATLGTDYAVERTLQVEARTEIDLETTLFEMVVDGQPVDRPDSGSSSSLVREAVFAHQVLAGTAKGPTHVRLAFERLAEETVAEFGGEERTDDQTGPLEGVVLEITVDEEGATACERVEGQSPDDETVAEDHLPTLFLDAFLPEGEVEEGAVWDLEDEAVCRGLAVALDQRLFPPAERGGDRGEGRGEGRRRGRGGRGGRGSGGSLGLIEWTGTAKLAEATVDHEGVACARIHLELEGAADLPEPEFGGGGPRRERAFEFPAPRVASLVAGTVKAGLEGDLFVSLESHAPVALELDGELEIEAAFEGDRGGRSFSSRTVQSGRWSLVVTVEEEKQ